MSSLAGVKVLVAEDDFLIRLHLSDVFSGEGAEVVTASEVEEILRLPPGGVDLAVLDRTLADGDVGPAAARLEEQGVGLVFLTGDTDAGSLRRRFPGAAVLSKPISDRALVSACAPWRPAS